MFQLRDYELICKYLVTPAELADYLAFREEIYLPHATAVNSRKEEYLLAHFFTTRDTSVINDTFADNLERVDTETASFDVSWILNNFFEKLVMYQDGKETDYHYIVKEIAKLNREELKGFNERYHATLENVKTATFSLPLRFVSSRTQCGFVFITLLPDKAYAWHNCLINMTEMYKYKHKLTKCLGVIMFRDPPYYEIRWAYCTGEWEADEELAAMLKGEEEVYGGSEIRLLPRYQFKY